MQVKMYPERFGAPPDPWWKRNWLWRLVDDVREALWYWRWARRWRRRKRNQGGSP